MFDYKRQSHVGLFVVSTVRFETPILMHGRNIRTCETMVFEAAKESHEGCPVVQCYQDLYSQKHEWDTDLDSEHEKIVHVIKEGLISLPAPPVVR